MTNFVLPLPPTTNQQYGRKGNRSFLSSVAKAWKDEAQWRMKAIRPKLLSTPVVLTIRFYLKFDRDVDNAKLLLDAMSGIVYEDDSQVVEYHVYKIKDKTNPRVEIDVI